MRVKIELIDDIEEDEITIRCKNANKTIQKIEQAIWDLTSSVKKLSFTKGEKDYYLSLDTIIFFETTDGRVNAHTNDDVFQIKYRLYELEEILSGNFLRISKSTIVNIDKIFSISRSIASPSSIQFYNSHKQVYVSRFYYKELVNKLEERRNYEN